MKRRRSSAARIADEAASWVFRLENKDFDPSDPFPDPAERRKRFGDWVIQSETHVKEFMELRETYRAFGGIDLQHLVDINALLEPHKADVVTLFEDEEGGALPTDSDGDAQRSPMSRVYRVTAWAAAPVASLILLSWSWMSPGSQAFATSIGEQHSFKLEDGSVVHLNTDSRVEVQYTRGLRNLRLLRGEALFTVEKEPKRPFIVDAGNARVSAVGTQFDVYRREQQTDISVVSGTVKIGTKGRDGWPAEALAGEQARVTGETITVNRDPKGVAHAVSWRERKLVFEDAPLSTIVDEFNRYNRRQIRLEGKTAKETRLSATFEKDSPEILVDYVQDAASELKLKVQKEGDGWVIGEAPGPIVR